MNATSEIWRADALLDKAHTTGTAAAALDLQRQQMLHVWRRLILTDVETADLREEIRSTTNAMTHLLAVERPNG